jgi:DNA-binding transcriptional MerR regulator
MVDKRKKPRRRPRRMNAGLRGLQDKYLSGAPLSKKDVMKRDMMMDNEPRMQDRSPEGQMFSIEAEIKNMMEEYQMAVRDGDNQRAQMIADQIDRMQQKIIDLQGGIANKMMATQRMAEGGEAEMPEMEMSEQEAMAELEAAGPDFEIVEQLIGAVVQMIQQGVSEAEVKEFLREQGLDEEDIQELFEMVMERLQQASVEEPIGKELQGMM